MVPFMTPRDARHKPLADPPHRAPGGWRRGCAGRVLAATCPEHHHAAEHGPRISLFRPKTRRFPRAQFTCSEMGGGAWPPAKAGGFFHPELAKRMTPHSEWLC